MNFTKGLPHDEFGIVKAGAYEVWVAEVNAAYAHGAQPQDFSGVPTGCGLIKGQLDKKPIPWRGWESPRSGHAYDLMGPDSGEVAMPPAPYLGSDELVGEMAEVYAMALLRDCTFEEIQAGKEEKISSVIAMLNDLLWFSGGRKIEKNTLFRGSTAGARTGPYLSQFLLQGPREATTVPYGPQEVNLAAEQFPSNRDYMTTWQAWLDVQQGADTGKADLGLQRPEGGRRLITTPRDLSRYVQIDALYQAYQVATLTLLDPRVVVETQAGFPSGNRSQPRASFATFGGPHVLSLVTEVATRALKAVRRQKFNHHRRARPERIGAMLTLASHGLGDKLGNAQMGIELMLAELKRIGIAGAVDQFNRNATLPDSVKDIAAWNTDPDWWLTEEDHMNLLLPMAFIEGSPMHPAYGAGHATVAGACVTMIKCFFKLVEGMMPGHGMTTMSDIGLDDVKQNTSPPVNAASLSVTGELDKLAANISIGRNMAGVHFATDYTESIRMGERIAVGMVAEQLGTYGEGVSIMMETFDGDRLKMVSQGTDFPRTVDFHIVEKTGRAVSFHAWWQRHAASKSALTS